MENLSRGINNIEDHLKSNRKAPIFSVRTKIDDQRERTRDRDRALRIYLRWCEEKHGHTSQFIDEGRRTLDRKNKNPNLSPPSMLEKLPSSFLLLIQPLIPLNAPPIKA